jgi:hypothetical protein
MSSGWSGVIWGSLRLRRLQGDTDVDDGWEVAWEFSPFSPFNSGSVDAYPHTRMRRCQISAVCIGRLCL